MSWDTKKKHRASGTHLLESAEGGTSQETEREQAIGAHILESAKGRMSQGKKNPTSERVLTS